MIAVLAGGTGAAKLLAGLVEAVDPDEITVIGNTGDDAIFHGLHVSPDLDTISYTLAGEINPGTGWGLADETWRAMGMLGALGGETWFHLGDKDLGTHLYRTSRLSSGATLSQVTSEITEALGVGINLLPMSDDPIRTRLSLLDGSEVSFQDYFVRLHHAVPISAVRFAGVARALPAPGVLEAIAGAKQIIVAPSNPVVSIGPILAVPGVKDALVKRRESVVAISPIVAGAALKGPADRLLRELGHEASAVGVARLLTQVASTLVIDHADADLSSGIAACGMRCVATEAVMSSPKLARALAERALAEAG